MLSETIFSQGDHEQSPVAILALANGTIFRGRSIGANGYTTAEIVFNTAMTGYQEILTDPSYTQQIVTLTYPHIGNTGINSQDIESNNIHVAGLVVRNCPNRYSNFRANKSLPEYLKENNVVAIADIDTRKLTRIIREQGAQGACILAEDNAEKALELARSYGGMVGQGLVDEVCVKEQQEWTQSVWDLKTLDYGQQHDAQYHVVAYDFGVKSNILRLLAERGCRVTLVPARTSAQAVLAMKPDGVFLANGPGDPAVYDFAIDATKSLLEAKIPLFGICLGHQVMGLAVGGQTLKMKTGHHGANHPVRDLETGRVFITSQNHGFAVDPDSLPSHIKVTHISLFDGTLQGFEFTDRPAFCFQGHPEASPGPHDIIILFDKFISHMAQTKTK